MNNRKILVLLISYLCVRKMHMQRENIKLIINTYIFIPIAVLIMS